MTQAPKPASRLGIVLVILVLPAFGWLWYTGAFGGSAPAGPGPGYVDRANLGADWPLTVDSGTLECTNDRSVILHAFGGIYAVNGTARGQMEQRGWKDIRQITAPHPTIKDALANVLPLVDRGLALCR